jgi:group I intron endonuclease
MKRVNPEGAYKKSGIYIIECNTNGKVYVGAAKNLGMRLNFHKSELRLKKHANKYLQADFNEFGEENFCFKIIFFCSVECLESMEQKAFDIYKCTDRSFGYNIWSAGKKGRKPNNELRKKFHHQGKDSKLSRTTSKKVLDTNTGIIYQSIGDAYKETKVAPFRTLCRWLQYPEKNKSNLRYA